MGNLSDQTENADTPSFPRKRAGLTSLIIGD